MKEKLQSPLKKVTPSFPATPFKNWDPIKPLLFEHLVGGSTLPSSSRKRGEGGGRGDNGLNLITVLPSKKGNIYFGTGQTKQLSKERRYLVYYGVAGHGKGLVDAMSSFGVKTLLREAVITNDFIYSSAFDIHEYQRLNYCLKFTSL